MSLYLVARVHIRDKERFLDYQNAVLELIAKKQLEVLALDDDAATVEGEAKEQRLAILRFENREAFDAFWNSPEYQAIVSIRHESADSTIHLLQEENLLIQ